VRKKAWKSREIHIRTKIGIIKATVMTVIRYDSIILTVVNAEEGAIV